MILISDEIQEYWDMFISQRVDLSHLSKFKFEAWSFGNTKDMAEELGQLVLEGKKTATCSLLRAIVDREMKYLGAASSVFYAMEIQSQSVSSF